MKISGYKYQLEQALIKMQWEITETSSSGQWWDDEHWNVRLKFDPHCCFYLCFKVDPLFEGERTTGQGIIEVLATMLFPENATDTKGIIASLDMRKGKFDEKLEVFMSELEGFKSKR